MIVQRIFIFLNKVIECNIFGIYLEEKEEKFKKRRKTIPANRFLSFSIFLPFSFSFSLSHFIFLRTGDPELSKSVSMYCPRVILPSINEALFTALRVHRITKRLQISSANQRLVCGTLTVCKTHYVAQAKNAISSE